MRAPSRLLFPCLAIFALAAMASPRPVVGTLLSTGSFHVDHTAGSGTATVLSGDLVETSAATSRILMKNGTSLNLAPSSGGTVYADHATLSSGTLRVKSSSGPFPIDAKSFVVTPAPGTDAVLQVEGSTLTVNVASGSAQIASASGETLAHLNAGNTLAFANASAGEPVNESSVHLMGVLDNQNGHYLVRDRFTNSVSEVTGPVEPKLVNHLVTVDGKSYSNQKSTIFHADRVVHVSKLAATDAAMGLPCAVDGAGGIAKIVMLSGVLSKVREHFLVQGKQTKTYEVVGDINDKEIGSNIHEKGFILPNRSAILPAEGVAYVDRRKLVAMASPCVGAVVGSSLISTGVVAMPKTESAAATTTPISF